jgi:hypothetical protein
MLEFAAFRTGLAWRKRGRQGQKKGGAFGNRP